jgi:hypothetical protein
VVCSGAAVLLRGVAVALCRFIFLKRLSAQTRLYVPPADGRKSRLRFLYVRWPQFTEEIRYDDPLEAAELVVWLSDDGDADRRCRAGHGRPAEPGA